MSRTLRTLGGLLAMLTGVAWLMNVLSSWAADAPRGMGLGGSVPSESLGRDLEPGNTPESAPRHSGEGLARHRPRRRLRLIVWIERKRRQRHEKKRIFGVSGILADGQQLPEWARKRKHHLPRPSLPSLPALPSARQPSLPAVPALAAAAVAVPSQALAVPYRPRRRLRVVVWMERKRRQRRLAVALMVELPQPLPRLPRLPLRLPRPGLLSQRRLPRHRRLAIVLAVIAIAGIGVGLYAYFTAGATGTGGQAIAGTVGAPTDVTVPAYSTTGTVHVSWTGSTLSNGSPVGGYYVTRYSSPVAACGTSITSTITALFCDDTGVPDGPHTYVVSAAFHNWFKDSAPSAQTVFVDTVKPVTTPTGSDTNWHNSDVKVHLDASDSGYPSTGSGVANLEYSVDGGTAVDVAGSGGTASTDVTIPAPSDHSNDGSHTITFFASDAAGNDETAQSVTVKIDTQKPSTTDDAPSGWHNTDQTVHLTPTDAGGSGIDKTYYAFGSPSVADPTTSSTQGTTVSLSGDGLWQLKYFSVDKAGNQEAVETAANTVMIDETKPTPGAVVTSGAYVNGPDTYVKNGQALTDTTTSDPTVNSASSGVASVEYFYCSSGCGGTTPTSNPGLWTSIGTATSGSYSVTWNSQPADGTYSLIGKTKDVATNFDYTAIAIVKVDNTPPNTTDNSATVGNGWFNSDQSVTLTPTDPVTGGVHSGVDKTYYEKGSPSAATPTTSSSNGTSVALNGDGLWQVKYFSTDHVGNQEGVQTTGTTVRIDEHNPDPGAVVTSGAYVNGGTTYIKTGQALTDTSTSDPIFNGASSGVATVEYFRCSSGCAATTPTSNPGLWTSIGTATSGSYSVTWDNHLLADGVYSLIAKTTDNASNFAYSAIQPVTVDNSAPTSSAGLSPSPNGAGWNKADTTVTLSSSDGAGSGVASITYSATGAQPIGQTTHNGAGNVQIVINTEGTTVISYHGVDNLGNQETPDKTVTVKLDKTKPQQSFAFTGTSGGEFISGSADAWTIYFQGTTSGQFNLVDAVTESGSLIATNGISFPAFGSTPTNWTAPGAKTCSTSPCTSNQYKWTGGLTTGTPADQTVTASDNASNTDSAVLHFVNDTTPPDGSPAFSVNGTAASSGGSTSTTTSTSFSITGRVDYTETQNSTQSGLHDSTLTIQSETLTSGVCGAPGSGGPYPSATPISGTTNPAITAGFCYLYKLTGTDNVGNTASLSSTVTVYASNTVNYNSAGSFTLHIPAGVTSVNFTIVGAGGGGAGGSTGGAGTSISGTVTLASNLSGTTLTVIVASGGTGGSGGAGGSTGYGSGGAGGTGATGGAGGGASSAIETSGATVIVVAAGGGGAGGNRGTSTGGTGGAGGLPTTSSTANSGVTGGTGTGSGTGGTGGSTSAGGVAANGAGGSSPNGTAGGNGGSSAGGGGGGGGWGGGAGGTANSGNNKAGGGGGGGSSYFANASGVTVTITSTPVGGGNGGSSGGGNGGVGSATFTGAGIF